MTYFGNVLKYFVNYGLPNYPSNLFIKKIVVDTFEKSDRSINFYQPFEESLIPARGSNKHVCEFVINPMCIVNV